jgi:hypothetical protein
MDKKRCVHVAAPVADARAHACLTARSPVIVVSKDGAKPPEVIAIVLLAGVERILAAQPKGSSNVVPGPWNVGMREGTPWP